MAVVVSGYKSVWPDPNDRRIFFFFYELAMFGDFLTFHVFASAPKLEKRTKMEHYRKAYELPMVVIPGANIFSMKKDFQITY